MVCLVGAVSDQVTVLSEGYTLYFGAPSQAVDWFSGNLGYSYQPQQDGAVSDWLMDAVSVGFSKPVDFAARCVPACFRVQHRHSCLWFVCCSQLHANN